MLHLSQSKIAIAVAGNFAFALALCTYKFMIKVRSTLCISLLMSAGDHDDVPTVDPGELLIPQCTPAG